MRKKIAMTDLTELASFNSGYISGGIDYWTLYLHEEFPQYLFIFSDGVNFGWEYTRWEFAPMISTEDISFFKADTVADEDKCKKIIDLKKNSVHDLGLSYPDM